LSLPTITEYRNALQNPGISLPWALNVEVVRDRTGMPIVHSGNFAAAFRIRRGAESWSLRCFHRPVPDLEARVRYYQDFQKGISQELKSSLLPEELRSIKVSGASHPIVSMPWVEGEGLRKWAAANFRDPPALRRAKASLVRLFYLMEEAGSVHGDLQTGNIMVRPNGNLALLDYDSFTFRNGVIHNPGNQGHPSFQHPAYDPKRHGRHADKLPFLILCMALDALACMPSLWDRFGAQAEGLLFESSDLRWPKGSPLLNALGSNAGMAQGVAWLEELLSRDPEDLPELPLLLSPPKPRGLMHSDPVQRPKLAQLMAKRQRSAFSAATVMALPQRPPEPSPTPEVVLAPPCPTRRSLHPFAALILILAGGMLAFAGRATLASLRKVGHTPTQAVRPAPSETDGREISFTQLRTALKMSAVLAGTTQTQERAFLETFDRETDRHGADPSELKTRLAKIPGAPMDWVSWMQGNGLHIAAK